MARQGKIARLPHSLREQVCQRLLDGQTAGTILAWLNPLPEAILTWDTYFDGNPATEQNLSEWRQGGYRRWLDDRQKIEDTKALQQFAVAQAKAGKNLSSGLQAIYTGHLMEALETLVHLGSGDSEKDDPVKRITALGGVIATLRNADTAAERVDLQRDQTKVRKDTVKLAREKFETQTVEKFMQFAQTAEVQNILNSGAKKSVQMAELRKIIFGARP